MALFSDLFEGYTVFLYMFIILISAIVAGMSQDKSGKFNRPEFFVLSFLILWIFIFFSYTGVDMENYMDGYKDSSFSWDYVSSYNLGYQGFAALTGFLHLLIKDPLIGIGCVKTISLFCAFNAMYLMRKQLHLGYSVLIFASVYYLYGFSAIKWSLSGSLCLLSSTSFLLNHKIKALILSLLATTIHVSVIGFLMFQLFALFLRLDQGLNKKKLIAILGVITAIMVVGYAFVQRIAATGLLFAENRFDYTMEDGATGLGLGQFVKFIPLVWITLSGIIYTKKKGRTDLIYITSYAFYYSIISLGIGMLGYKMGQIGRLDYSLSFPFIIFLPFFIQQKIPLYITSKIFLNKQLVRLFAVVFIFVRFILQLSVNYHGVGLEEYKTILF